MIPSKIFVAIVLAHSALAFAAPAKKNVENDDIPKAVPVAKESRIVRYTYSPDVIFRILALPTLHTHIELGEDEGLKEEPMIGDRKQWVVSGGPRNIYVKPLQEDIDTSLTIVTNKRVYQFQLIAGKKNGQVFQKVTFDYPDRDAAVKLRQEVELVKDTTEQARLDNQIVGPDVDPNNLNFDFAIVGKAEFKPTSVYTDGKFTWLRLPNTQDTPAVFLIDEHGNPSLINYKTKDNLIIVERSASQLLLKLGAAEVRVIKRPADGSARGG